MGMIVHKCKIKFSQSFNALSFPRHCDRKVKILFFIFFVHLCSGDKYTKLMIIEINRNILINKYIEDIYFFEVNTKYISSNVLKISVISRVHSTSEIAYIFNI